MAWPNAIFKLTAPDFTHNSYMRVSPLDREFGLGRDDDYEKVISEEGAFCGTRCCLVGWVRAAFGCTQPFWDRVGDGDRGEVLPAEGQRFLRKLLSLGGHKTHNGRKLQSLRNGDLENAASGVFEHGSGEGDAMTEEHAADLWKQTGLHFNYDM